MRNFLYCLGILGFVPFCAIAQQTSVLFIGNSYTYTSDLPGTLKSLALAGGDSIYHESSTPGGYTFAQHATNATTLEKIASRDWDFVVLQEQSQLPSFPPSQVASESYPYAAVLVDSIRSNYECTEPVFFMTWGRKDGDQSNCAGYPPLCTFEGMNARLHESYLEMGVDNDATVAPCGAAWYQMSVDDNVFWNGLYSGDGSHPSAWGTYLNACVFYATIFRRSPVGITYYSNIGQQDAENLQQLAEDIVLDSSGNWFIGHQDVVSNATYGSYIGLTVDFIGSSENATAHHWDFGDGQTSDLETTQHTYPTNGIYSVIHIASSFCDADTSTFEVSLSTTSVNTAPLAHLEIIASNGTVTLKNVLRSQVVLTIIDYSGREVMTTTVNPTSTAAIELNAAAGVYLCRLSDGRSQVVRRFFIN